MSKPLLLACAAAVALSGCATAGKATENVSGAGQGAEDGKAELARLKSEQTKTEMTRASTLKAKATISEPPKAAAKSKSAGKGPAKIDPVARAAIEHEDGLAQMTFWAGEYATFPNDAEAAGKFADALRKGGRADRAVEVASTAMGNNSDSRPLLRSYGLALLAAGRSGEAVQPLTMAVQRDPQDWRTMSSLGVALDEQGRYEEARDTYKRALALKPDDPGILTNLGVSHLMVGQTREAEIILKQAAALPTATPETRQNLSLAVGLQGRFDEAEQLQKVDLPPAMVANNMAYMRGLIIDDRRWGDLGSKTSRQ
jgi:Flp pilus assembly protein TadD